MSAAPDPARAFRDEQLFDARLVYLAGLGFLAGAFASVVLIGQEYPDIGQQNMVAGGLIVPTLIGVGAWFIRGSRRRIVIARTGQLGTGTVLHGLRSGSTSPSSESSRVVVVLATIGDRQFEVRSAHSSGIARGAPVQVLWHERYPDIALVSAQP